MSVTADATLQLTRQVLLPPQVHGPLVGVLVVSIVVDILGRRVGGSAGRRVGGSAAPSQRQQRPGSSGATGRGPPRSTV
ncbi:MAG: hypothetical protein HY241_09890 [Actinobacteria bacterium]|nr:hypothetical protein [Actinomycetota bacterium]